MGRELHGVGRRGRRLDQPAHGLSHHVPDPFRRVVRPGVVFRTPAVVGAARTSLGGAALNPVFQVDLDPFLPSQGQAL